MMGTHAIDEHTHIFNSIKPKTPFILLELNVAMLQVSQMHCTVQALESSSPGVAFRAVS
jgi:hypothetical protein